MFRPGVYISAEDAREILDRVLAQLGLEMQFSFTQGDYSYMLTPYTTRADIARAFYNLCQQMPLTETFDGQVFLGETECPARVLDGSCYVPLQSLQQVFPELTVEDESQPQIPVWNTDRVLPYATVLRNKDIAFMVNGFIYRGTPYVDLNTAAVFLALDIGTGI